jgi:glycosidase
MFACAAALGTMPDPEVFSRRDADWRAGAVVYQAFVDRFAPSKNLEAKRALYSAPRRLRPWSEPPKGGEQDRALGFWTHELDFWGGDLASLRGRLDHIRGLGATVLYLNPIFEAESNHKYDALDFFRIDPAYGSQADFDRLVGSLKQAEMRLVLDGVFNHMSLGSPLVRQKPKSWFYPDPDHPSGFKTWARTGRLIELNLENPEVQAYFWGSKGVVGHWLRQGADGWRLDVAQELGFSHLKSITEAAHRAKPGSLVVGEVWAYPELWNESMDGSLNMMLGEMIIGFAKAEIAPGALSAALAGLEPEAQLRSWTILGNHDTDRIATRLPDPRRRSLARALQFTLPGSPMIYYGEEAGMTGGFDPAQRAPMDWDAAAASPDGAEIRRLSALRSRLRALRIGDFVPLPSQKLLAFARRTEKAREIVYVAANPGSEAAVEVLPTLDSKVLGYTLFRDVLTGAEVRSVAGTIRFEVPPGEVRIFSLVDEPARHDQYRRIDG